MNIAFVAVLVMLLFMFLKVPVFVSVLCGAATYFLFTPATQGMMLVQRFIAGVESIPLLAIPFFIGMGVFMQRSGVTRRIVDFASVMVGRMSGGLAQVNILVSTFMGGISGSNLADAAMTSKNFVPQMIENGYSNPFSSVITAFSSLITPLIPPGIGMIMYASVTNISVGRLFVSGLSIGILLCVIMMIQTAYIAKKRNYGTIRKKRPSLQEYWSAFKGALVPLILPVVIIGGVRIGAFTASEAGAVGIIVAVVMGLVYKELDFKGILDGLRETAIASATILLIIGAANALSWTLTKEQIPQMLTKAIVDLVPNKYVFLFTINIFLLIIGMLIEGNAITIVIAPLLFPIARAFGINDIHFAIIFIFNLAIGAISPPMGTVMYVTCGITKCKIAHFLREAVPYFIMLFFMLMAVTYIPFLSTWML